MAPSEKRQKVTDSEIIEAIKDISDPFVTAKELAEQLPISRQQVNDRLRDLEQRGILSRKKAGSGQGWWIVGQKSS